MGGKNESILVRIPPSLTVVIVPDGHDTSQVPALQVAVPPVGIVQWLVQEPQYSIVARVLQAPSEVPLSLKIYLSMTLLITGNVNLTK
jgi:hypothetical protein